MAEKEEDGGAENSSEGKKEEFSLAETISSFTFHSPSSPPPPLHLVGGGTDRFGDGGLFSDLKEISFNDDDNFSPRDGVVGGVVVVGDGGVLVQENERDKGKEEGGVGVVVENKNGSDDWVGGRVRGRGSLGGIVSSSSPPFSSSSPPFSSSPRSNMSGEVKDQSHEGQLIEENRSLSTQILFSLGALARVDFVMQNYFLQTFLYEVAYVNPVVVGLIMIVRKVWDAFTDPVVGKISDSTPTPRGRRSPWIVLFCVPITLFWLLQWLVQPFGEWGISFYYTIVLLCYSTLHTFQVIPYRALIPDVAQTYNSRSSLATWMQVLGLSATVFAVTISGKFIEEYPSNGFFYAALFMAPLVGIPRVIGALCVKERPYEEPKSTKEDGTASKIEGEVGEGEEKEVKKGEIIGGERGENEGREGGGRKSFMRLQERIRFWTHEGRDFAIVALACFLYAIAGAVLTTNFILALRYVFSITTISVALFLHTFSSILSLPFWFAILRKIGKIRTFTISCICASTMLFAMALAPSSTPVIVFYGMIFLFGFSEAASLVLQAMIPDSVQSYEKATGRRDEAFLYSISLVCFKIGQAIGFSFSSFVLALAGYSASFSTQPESVLIALRVLAFGFPGALILFGIVLIRMTTDFGKRENSMNPKRNVPSEKIQ